MTFYLRSSGALNSQGMFYALTDLESGYDINPGSFLNLSASLYSCDLCSSGVVLFPELSAGLSIN